MALTADLCEQSVSVNEFSATCNWQVVGVQIEQNRCKDRALRKAVTLRISGWIGQLLCLTIFIYQLVSGSLPW